MLKAEKKEEAEGKTPTGSHAAASPEEQSHSTTVHLQRVKKKTPNQKPKTRSFSGPPHTPKVNRPKS